MLHLLGIAFIIIALGIAFDITINSGDAISSIFESIRPNSSPSTKQEISPIDYISEIKEELDDLYDDLTYDNDEKEIIAIKAKITLRENLIKELLNKA